jgi:flagellar biosynthesis chaperone FliJ
MPDESRLGVLHRLRRLQVLSARRELQDRLGDQQDAELAASTAAARLQAEAMRAAEHLAHFSAWLPRGLAQLREREAKLGRAQDAVETASGELVAARTAENATEVLRDAARAEAAEAAARRAQAALDEVASNATRRARPASVHGRPRRDGLGAARPSRP